MVHQEKFCFEHIYSLYWYMMLWEKEWERECVCVTILIRVYQPAYCFDSINLVVFDCCKTCSEGGYTSFSIAWLLFFLTDGLFDIGRSCYCIYVVLSDVNVAAYGLSFQEIWKQMCENIQIREQFVSVESKLFGGSSFSIVYLGFLFTACYMPAD